MKFTLHHEKSPANYWNGKKPLPADIHVMSYDLFMAELELLTILCSLHGYLTAFDILTGANKDTEKDKDMDAVMTAFQMYLYPRMPLSYYTEKDKRVKPPSLAPMVPIDSSDH
jgi:hypothetical protein